MIGFQLNMQKGARNRVQIIYKTCKMVVDTYRAQVPNGTV